MEMDKDVLIIGGKDIPAKTTKLDIFELNYYGENPRINSLIAALPQPVPQEEIEKQIWDQNSVHELFVQVKNNGGLLEPVLVKGNEVVEGNCRLCCYRKLYQKASEGEKGRWREIPARVLPDDLTEEEIFILLGTIHVTAKTPWDPFEKASYVWRMAERLKKDWNQIATLLGMERAGVERAAEVYSFMRRNEMKDIKKYSYVDEFFKSPDLKKLVANDPSLENSMVDWINNDVIPDAQSMRQLAHILSDSKIGPKFTSGRLDFEDALEATQDRHPELTSTFYKKLKKMNGVLEKAHIKEIQEEIDADKRKKATIEYFLKAVHRFEKSLDFEKKR